MVYEFVSAAKAVQYIGVCVYNYLWQNRPFQAMAFLRRFCQTCLELDHSAFASLDFAAVIFLQSKVTSLASLPQPGGPGLFIYIPH
jgi:hypothetical protein